MGWARNFVTNFLCRDYASRDFHAFAVRAMKIYARDVICGKVHMNIANNSVMSQFQLPVTSAAGKRAGNRSIETVLRRLCFLILQSSSRPSSPRARISRKSLSSGWDRSWWSSWRIPATSNSSSAARSTSTSRPSIASSSHGWAMDSWLVQVSVPKIQLASHFRRLVASTPFRQITLHDSQKNESFSINIDKRPKGVDEEY